MTGGCVTPMSCARKSSVATTVTPTTVLRRRARWPEQWPARTTLAQAAVRTAGPASRLTLSAAADTSLSS